EAPAALLAALGQLALLARDRGHRLLRRRDVGGGDHPGPDVARVRCRRLPREQLRRDRRRAEADVPAARYWRRALPRRRRADGRQRLADDRRAPARRGAAARSPVRSRSGSADRRRAGRIGIRKMSFTEQHKKIERNVTLLGVFAFVAVVIGGVVEIAPLFWIDNTIEKVEGMRPYTPLEQAGRDIYVREGCYTCHSQMIRPFRDEVERYGHYSLAAESMYDHPFQWGSKRTGPDLARVGGRYSDEWHVQHLKDPRSVVPESIMPTYAFLAETDLVTDNASAKLTALS